MKALISILIALLVGLGAYKIWAHWQQLKQQRISEERAARGTDIQPEQLDGLPSQLEPKLKEALQAGPAALKRFLDACKQYPNVRDPRLAWIELDYVVLISGTNPAEAKRTFAAVKERTPVDSPIYPRIRALEKIYE